MAVLVEVAALQSDKYTEVHCSILPLVGANTCNVYV